MNHEIPFNRLVQLLTEITSLEPGIELTQQQEDVLRDHIEYFSQFSLFISEHPGSMTAGDLHLFKTRFEAIHGTLVQRMNTAGDNGDLFRHLATKISEFNDTISRSVTSNGMLQADRVAHGNGHLEQNGIQALASATADLFQGGALLTSEVLNMATSLGARGAIYLRNRFAGNAAAQEQTTETQPNSNNLHQPPNSDINAFMNSANDADFANSMAAMADSIDAGLLLTTNRTATPDLLKNFNSLDDDFQIFRKAAGSLSGDSLTKFNPLISRFADVVEEVEGLYDFKNDCYIGESEVIDVNDPKLTDKVGKILSEILDKLNEILEHLKGQGIDHKATLPPPVDTN